MSYVRQLPAVAAAVILGAGVVMHLLWTGGLARSLGAEATGLVGLMLATALVSSLVARLGTDSLLLRSVVRTSRPRSGGAIEPEPADIARSALALSVGAASIGAAFIVIVIIGGGPPKLFAVGFGLTLNVVVSCQYLGSELLKGQHRPLAATAIQSLFLPACLSVAVLLLILLRWLTGFDPQAHPHGMLTITAVTVGVGGILARGLVGGLLELQRYGRFMPRVVARAAAPFLSTSLLNLLIAQGFILIAAITLTTNELGSLTLASRVALLVGLPLVAVNFTMAAPLLEAAERNPPRLTSLWRRSVVVALLGAAGLATTIAVGVTALLGVVDATFHDLRATLAVLIVAQLVNSATGSVGFVMIGCGAESALARTSAAATAVLLAGILVFRLAGPVGAASAVLLSTLTQNGLNALHASRAITARSS